MLFEILLLSGGLAVSAAAYITHVWDKVLGFVEAGTWTYLICLALLRPVAERSGKDRRPGLHRHSAILYGVQFIFAVILLSSTLFGPSLPVERHFQAALFVLSSALNLFSVSTNGINQNDQRNFEPWPELWCSTLSSMTFA